MLVFPVLITLFVACLIGGVLIEAAVAAYRRSRNLTVPDRTTRA
jgi:hypothetical protein